MSAESILQTGSFTADGNNKTLKLRSDVDKIVIENQTQWAASNNGYGFRYTWYRDMGTTANMEYHPAGDHTVAVNESTSAIQLIDSSDYSLGAVTAVTAGTNAVGAVYSTGDTSGLANGSIVRLISTAHTNLNGLDFSIDDLSANTSFALANDLATAPGAIAGASGYYRSVAPDLEIYRMFTPSNRNIAKIDKATSIVTTLVDHGYAVGSKVKFSIPAEAGMIELNGVEGTITAVTAGTFTVDTVMTAMTTFTFPVITQVPCQIPSVVPVGDGKSTVSSNTPSKFYNQSFIGLILTGGTTSPAGNSGDTVRWTAYKAEIIDDE